MYKTTLSAPRSNTASAPPKLGYERASYGLCLLALLLTLICVTAGLNPLTVCLIATILFGWSEVEGLCGTSHVLALTPLRMASGHSLWTKCVFAYTAGGLVTATLIGSLVGAIGMRFEPVAEVSFYLVPFVAIALIARELSWVSFPLPQVKRQTHKMWADQFGFQTGAAMWGAHIGIGFATVIAHGGFYVVVLMAAAMGPAYGAVLFGTFWLGRTCPIWLAPQLSVCLQGKGLHEELAKGSSSYSHVNLVGLILVGSVVVFLF